MAEDKNKIELPEPCDEIKKYLKEWEEKGHQILDDALNELFKKYPSNKDMNSVIIKASALNSIYHTYIVNMYGFSKHITEINNIDELIKEGKEEIIKTLGEFEGKNNYSFATKYCSFSNPEKFPIYDRNVNLMLWKYTEIDNFYNFKKKDLKDYTKIKKNNNRIQKTL